MSRVEGRDSLLVRISDRYVKRTYGRAMEITGAIGNSTWNMIGWGVLEFGHDRAHKVDERLKMLAETKVATTVGCQFCIDMATALGRKSGVTEEQLHDFHSYKESAAFSPLEKLAMEYAEEMSQTNVEISDELFAKLREHLDNEQIVELTAGIAIENFRSRFNNALEIPSAGFSDGQYCPLPEGRAALPEAVAGNGAP